MLYNDINVRNVEFPDGLYSLQSNDRDRGGLIESLLERNPSHTRVESEMRCSRHRTYFLNDRPTNHGRGTLRKPKARATVVILLASY